MKTLQNPTTFFFKQADNLTNDHSKEIDQFVNKLIDINKCTLCMQNYDILIRVPRIMIHCGHTFCTPCLKQFYMNRRVRCPMCLKLVKQLDKLQRLPINHTIFTHLVQKDKQMCEKSNIKPIVTDASKTLFAEFQKSQKQAHMKQNPQKIDPDSGLPFCVFHPDRVQHFYCATHASAGCRVCSEIGHSKADCKVIDLYQIEDPNQLNQMIAKSKVQSHILSNQPQIQSSSSAQQVEKGMVFIGQTSAGRTKYLKTKNGNIIPAMDDNDENEDIDYEDLRQYYANDQLVNNDQQDDEQ